MVADDRRALRPRMRDARTWYAEWSAGPRYRLDWSYNYRVYLGVIVLTVGPILGGIRELLGLNADSSRLFGLLAVLAGIVIATPFIAYLRRPALAHHERWYEDIATDEEAEAARQAVQRCRGPSKEAERA